MKNTDTPSIERLKETLRPFAALAADIDEFDPTTPDSLHPHDVDRDDMISLGDCRRAAIVISTLETLTPSAGEGVERIVGEGSEYKTLKDFCDALFREEDERKLDTLIGEAVTIMQALAAENARLSALASIPLEQPDIEGRARELLARFHESGGNKAAAFTVRKVGPTGIVLEAQHAVLVYALSLPTTEIRLEALDPASLRDFLSNAAQLIDSIKMEWSASGHWSEWDQSVRDDLTRQLSAAYAALACPPSRPSFDKWDFAGAVLDAARCAK